MPETASPRSASTTGSGGTRNGVLVTVVVPVRNGAEDLRALLAALEQQTLPRDRFEVVVGDDGSGDPAIAAVAATDGHVRLSTGPPLNSYAARNRAARTSRAPVLAFCDSDCRPDPAWLEAGLAALDRGDLVAGLVRFTVPDERTIWTLLDMDTFLDQERAVTIGRGVTANLFVRREVFDRVDGFDDRLPNQGDYDFVARCVAAGCSVSFSAEATVWHPTRNRARSFLRKLWAVNRMYATREARAGRRPSGLRFRNWVPVVRPLRVRRYFGRSLGLDRKRLAENGVSPSRWERARALPFMYIVMPYVSLAAQLRGWWDGRRLR